jgi:hypothetical protein
MNRYLFNGAFALGVAVLLWVGIGFLGSHGLALTMTVIIAGVYVYGALELHQFRHSTNTLTAALAAIPVPLVRLDDWLKGLHATVHNPVRLRIEGERNGLPGPALTPYLVGLLVMLGMLGTFLGMVVTLNGAVSALEGTSDLAAMRSVFAAPIKGLGLAFGTSVAGVAASAMLGLMSALSRRERLQAAQLLDSKIATDLRSFSLSFQRQETYKALQLQSQSLPQVADKLQTMMAHMEQLNLQLNDRLTRNQESFHSSIQGVYTDLAVSVDKSLRDSLKQSAHIAGESLKPAVEAALSGIAQEAKQLHSRLLEATQAQLDRMESHAEAMVKARMESETRWAQQNIAYMDQVATILRTELGTLKADEALRGDAAVARLGELQATVTVHLSTLGTALEDPITRLINTAAEAPRAAAEVIGQLRQEISSNVVRDNALLEERSRILETLNTLLASINHASVEQRAVIDSLVASSAVALQQAGSEFSNKLGVQADKLADMAAHVGSSAVEVSSLSDAFGLAVRSFGDSNDKLITHLQRIESALDKSMVRSDDQLAYYVAQAREIIDLSITSQKDVFDALRQISIQPPARAEEAA